MSPIERVPITAAGKAKLEAEIKDIRAVQRPKAIKAIEEARAHGDLSENAEYHAAKDLQGQLEGRLNFLEDQAARSEVIPPQTTAPDKILFGVEFSAIDIDSEQKVTYRIVGDYESDPENNMLAVQSPIARAFIGKQIDDEVVVRTPGGTRTFEVLSIQP